MKPGEALLLENLRFYPEEEGKPVGVEKGTPEFDAAKAEMKERQKKFAAKLVLYADVLCNGRIRYSSPQARFYSCHR